MPRNPNLSVSTLTANVRERKTLTSHGLGIEKP
jgi:hypothetical protein